MQLWDILIGCASQTKLGGQAIGCNDLANRAACTVQGNIEWVKHQVINMSAVDVPKTPFHCAEIAHKDLLIPDSLVHGCLSSGP